jgi:hypothetical protein
MRPSTDPFVEDPKKPEPKVKKPTPTPVKPKEPVVEGQPIEGQIAEEEKK